MTKKDQFIIFQSKEQLIEAAQTQADKVDVNFQHSTYAYFITRYFVSAFESRYGAIPIQVWNEYRNALDHFFRHLTDIKTQETSEQATSRATQLHKMEGHLQRAALDIMKLYCHNTKDSVDQLKATYKTEVIQLVDNGNFHSFLITETAQAENLFEEAKIYDQRLGETSNTDNDVINKYLEAVFVFDSLKTTLIDKTPDITAAQQSHDSIHNRASNGSRIHHLVTHTIFYIAWNISVFAIGMTWNSHIAPLFQSTASESKSTPVNTGKPEDPILKNNTVIKNIKPE